MEPHHQNSGRRNPRNNSWGWGNQNPPSEEKKEGQQQAQPQIKEREGKESEETGCQWCENQWAESELWGRPPSKKCDFCTWKMYNHPGDKHERNPVPPLKKGGHGERETWPVGKGRRCVTERRD